MTNQLDVNHTGAERIEEFQRRLAAALKRILAKQTIQTQESGDEQSGPGRP